ncbi:arabinan endo-1,5-alpha-L-arabinosidase [Sphingomonas sp. SORGH_AS802]|uniref:arabinan endo-1,5-alpha-L-arabinosidase n=1 Tax=unclassified Sphingomonas TaxID=196159 RepID=UPI0028623533|nr:MULTISPECIES: arabinan endo-1,5-alpha-L-arabinosidase [unclassified Sphingomonas]MDR6126891.1 arabinan endo-1,5-alpha-L-arabinosidase [Sphingomonas sp. SORGH_AS_0438]MDR6134747.1 arabinan endo-1,5-alpha-L-arabinosidase [Sphingomonas sp. SORGH_AS_0802]
MRGRSALAALLLAAGGAPVPAATAQASAELQGDIAPTHDPVIIREGGLYHVYSTGLGDGDGRIIAHRVSTDRVHWQSAPTPLPALPDWAKRAIPGATNAWAPDISYVGGRYRLYYSISTFGSNRSAIGLLTSPTLDPARPGYGWRDEGMVVRSNPSDDFNAIDPNFIRDRDGRQWLALGSFWSGLKLFALDPATGKPARPGEAPVSIARRPAPAGAAAPVEAPFLFDHGGWYWLVASYDYCCKGNASTYYTVIGRSRAITGPYLGKDGSAMMQGGGTLLLAADLPEKQRFRGPGHAGHMRDADGTDYLVYHAYDRENKGTPTLRLARLRWGADGWPVAER